MAVALILVDALSASYPATGALPILDKLAAGGLACPMTNIYAYRGIEATLFTGRSLSEHGVWCEFRPARRPEFGGVVGGLSRMAIRAGDLLPSDRLRLDVRYVAAKLQGRAHLPTGNLIPASLMPRFEKSIEAEIWAQSCLPVPTLFDEISSSGGSFENVVYPVITHDSQVLGRVRARLRQGNLPDLWYIKFSALDALGHKYGPHSPRLLPALKELNAQIANVAAALRKSYGDSLDIVALSDHGMSAVTGTVDVRPLLASTGLRAGRDYLYFLDSTTMRVWSKSERVLARIAAKFRGVEGAQVLSSEEKSRLHLPSDDSTGNLLVALDEGYVFFPDFFRKTGAPLGMHGYANVQTKTGLPFLALGPAAAALLSSRKQVGHADVWAVMRSRLGLSRILETTVPSTQHSELSCIS